jgi:phosphatidylglycerophosphatase C
MKKTIALFDFDGTITTIDSTKAFYKFLYKSKFQYFLYNYIYCFWVIILLKLRLINYLFLKKYRLNIHTSRFSENEFNQLNREFHIKIFNSLLNPKALKKIQWHENLGHDVWIISASYDFLLTQWSKNNNYNLITNKTEIKQGSRIMLGKDVNFDAKLEYLRLQINLDNYSKIYAYGDSEGDISMLSVADYKFYKPFRD